MLMTVKGLLRNGRIELTEMPAEAAEEAPVLVTFLSPAPSQKPREPLALYGAWKHAFPEENDLDAALKEIRGDWSEEWDDASLT